MLKFCLSARQNKEYLKKADELLVQWRDHEYIVDLMEINPEASYVLEIPDNSLTDKDWDTIQQYYIITKKRLKVSLVKLNFDKCIERNIPFFFSAAISEPWALNAVINMGVCAARITGELAHRLDYLNTLPIEIRVWANNSGAPFDYQPLVGGWFRPEDLYQLEAIDVCEFNSRDNREEQALYRIYAEQHAWSGQLSMIIKDINNDAIINRMIPPEFQERRSNCGMRCQAGGHCHFCETITSLANPDLLKPLKEKLND